MLEVMNESIEISQQTIELLDKQDPPAFKLPRIERPPSTNPPKQIRSTTRLPILRNDPSLQRLEVSSERRLPEEQNFIGTVERRVRLVKEEQNIAEEEESDDSSDDHFFRKIRQNKQIIQKAKRKNEQARKQNEQVNNYIRPVQFPKKSSAKHQQEKRGKDIREVGENRMQARKESRGHKEREFSKQRRVGKESAPHKESTALKETPQNKELVVREFKSKDELTPLNKILPSPFALRQDHKLKKQLSVKNLTPLQKNEQLFDAIHNYLENPKRSHPEIVNSVKICQNKAELQYRLKEYEQKLQGKDLHCLAHKQSVETERSEPLEGSEIQMATSSQWRKINPIRGLFAQQNSCFDQEIERINHYLARNEKSLDRYVQNQKMLIDVQMSRKQSALGP